VTTAALMLRSSSTKSPQNRLVSRGKPVSSGNPISTISRGTSTSREHLLWSPRLLRHTTISFACIALLGTVVGQSTSGDAIARAFNARAESALSAHSVQWWTVLSLLSSSCCVIQVALNVLSIGCAGFNTILGPVRPFWLATMLHAQWYAYTHGLTNVAIVALSCVVTLFPELVALFGAAGIVWRARRRQSREDAVVVSISLPTMGCIACIDSVTRAIRSVPEVTDFDVRLNTETDGGHARAVLSAIDEKTVSRLNEACRAAGFPPEPA